MELRISASDLVSFVKCCFQHIEKVGVYNVHVGDKIVVDEEGLKSATGRFLEEKLVWTGRDDTALDAYYRHGHG